MFIYDPPYYVFDIGRFNATKFVFSAKNLQRFNRTLFEQRLLNCFVEIMLLITVTTDFPGSAIFADA